jgi:hypothetical protein
LLLFPYKTYILVSAEITEKKNEKKTLMPSGSAMAVEEEAFTKREELSECEVFKIGENKAEDDDKREKEEIGEERRTLPFALVCPSFLKVDEKITFSSLRQQQEAIFIASGGLIIKEKGSFYSFPSMYSSLVNVTMQ